MPVQTSYSLYTRDAVVGALYGITLTNSVRHSGVNIGSAAISFGLGVKNVAGLGNDRQVELGSGAFVDGISMRQIDKQMNVVPGTGAIAYQKNEVVGILKDGYINVLLQAGAAAVKGAAAFVHATNGTFAADATGTHVSTTNVTFESTGVAGDIVVVNITRSLQA